MGKGGTLAAGVLGGTTTALVPSMTRRALHNARGTPRVPRSARRRSGIGPMLAWAAALGVLLALADVLREQRQASAPEA